MDKKILKILQEIQKEKSKMVSVNCENNITEVKTNDFEKYQAYEQSISIILSTLLEEDKPIPCSDDIKETEEFITLFEFGDEKVEIYFDNMNYIATFDDVEFHCSKLMDLKKELRHAILNKGIQEGKIVDDEEVSKNSSLV